jgi:mRNA-degrading endonuclease RelE of RelBE toxin-antitoxin system
MPYTGTMKVVATRGYDHRARKLFMPQERAAAELEIALAPNAWPVISGTGGARKARAARGGRGKSGDARIIYYVVTRKGVLYLLDVYAKSVKEDLTDAEKHEIRKLVAAIEAQA